MLGRNFFHQLHRELVMVSGNIRSRVDRRQLVLCGCNLIVFGFGKDPQLDVYKRQAVDSAFIRAHLPQAILDIYCNR